MLRQINNRLIRTQVYSTESKDWLRHSGVTGFLYRIFGDGRNTAVPRVLTHWILNYCIKYIKKFTQILTIWILFAEFDFSLYAFATGWNIKEYCVSNLFYTIGLIMLCDTLFLFLFLDYSILRRRFLYLLHNQFSLSFFILSSLEKKILTFRTLEMEN